MNALFAAVEDRVESLLAAWSNLARHRGRSALVILSTAVGAATLVLLHLLGSATISAVTSGVEAVGGKRMMLIRTRATVRASSTRYDRWLSPDDAAAIATHVPGVTRAEYYGMIPNQVGSARGRLEGIDIGVDFRAAMFADIAVGRDVASEGGREIVLSDGLARLWFAEPVAALHQRVTLWNHDYSVVGVTGVRGHMGVTIGTLRRDRAAFIASKTLVHEEALEPVALIAVHDDGTTSRSLEKRVIETLLEVRHARERDVEVMDMAEQVKQFNVIFVALRVLTAGLAGIALVIAGAGIVNVLLASVRERTAEIGVLRALGARSGDVKRDILLESSLIGLIGGLAGGSLGLVLGFAANVAVSRAIAEWPPAIQPAVVLYATITTTVMSLAFGLYPARVAARFSVVECLRQKAR